MITTEPQAFLANGVRAYEIDNDWELLQLVLSEPSITLSCLIDPIPEVNGGRSPAATPV